MSTEREKPRSLGFGFLPSRGASYHFVVTIRRSEESSVLVEERFVFDEDWEDAARRARMADDPEPLTTAIRGPQPKVAVSLHKWQLVAEEVRSDFNRRLRTAGQKASAWKQGENVLSPHLGKELTLLLWSVEDADPTLVPNAVANWSGLAPEERWWLYTTINAATGHITDGRGRGWRKAIGIAFTENPAAPRPYLSQNGERTVRRNGKASKSATADAEFSLFVQAADEPTESTV